MNTLKTTILISILFACLAQAQYDTNFSEYATKSPWVVTAQMIASNEAALPAGNWVESLVPQYTLPDMFRLADGTKVTTVQTWEEKRRGEMLDSIARVLYGVSPPMPVDLAFEVVQKDANAMGGKATLKRVAISFKLGSAQPFVFHLNFFVPNQRTGKAPVFLLLNHRGASSADYTRSSKSEFWPAEYVIARGYAIAVINVSDEVDPDRDGATTGIRAYYRNNHSNPASFTWGAISAWAWAGQRAADYFETDPDIDSKKMAVIGHSRGAKTSFWTGMQDTRFALTVVNCSGQSGPNITRRLFGRPFLSTVNANPHWYSPVYATYANKINQLPYDGHYFTALIAPRGLHVSTGANDLYNDPQGCWDAVDSGDVAYSLYGKTIELPEKMSMVNELLNLGPVAYHIRTGDHGLLLYDWKLHLDHADTYFSRTTAIVDKHIQHLVPAHSQPDMVTVYSISGRRLGSYSDIAASLRDFPRTTRIRIAYQPVILTNQCGGTTFQKHNHVLIEH